MSDAKQPSAKSTAKEKNGIRQRNRRILFPVNADMQKAHRHAVLNGSGDFQNKVIPGVDGGKGECGTVNYYVGRGIDCTDVARG